MIHSIKLSESERLDFEPCMAGGALATVHFEVFGLKKAKSFVLSPGDMGLIVFAMEQIATEQEKRAA